MGRGGGVGGQINSLKPNKAFNLEVREAMVNFQIAIFSWECGGTLSDKININLSDL